MGPTTVHRPILRHDVAFLEAQDGLVVRVDGVNFFVRGRTAYRYLSALVPHLDGDTTLAELVAGLPESQGDTVRSLIEALHSKGAVIDAHEPPEDIDESLLDQFADQRLLLLHHGDDGRGLARILAARVLVHGRDEQPMTQLMSALSDNGIGHGPDGLLAVTQGVTEDTLAGVDVLIHVCTQRHSGELLELARFCTAAGCAFLPIVRLGDQLMLGPWQGPGQSGGVASLLIRLRENAIDGADEILAAAAVGGPASRRPGLLAPAAPEIAVALAGFEVFKTLAGVIPSQLHDRVLFLDSLTLSTRSEFLVPHPCVSDYRADPPTSAPRSDDQIEADYTRYQGLVSAHCGLMAEFSDDKAPQIPLRVGVLSAPACAPEAIVEFGTDTVLGCRLRALERAAAHYALALHTRVDLLPAAGADARSVGRAQPGERSLRVAATDAFTGEQLALSKDDGGDLRAKLGRIVIGIQQSFEALNPLDGVEELLMGSEPLCSGHPRCPGRTHPGAGAASGRARRDRTLGHRSRRGRQVRGAPSASGAGARGRSSTALLAQRCSRGRLATGPLRRSGWATGCLGPSTRRAERRCCVRRRLG